MHGTSRKARLMAGLGDATPRLRLWLAQACATERRGQRSLRKIYDGIMRDPALRELDPEARFLAALMRDDPCARSAARMVRDLSVLANMVARGFAQAARQVRARRLWRRFVELLVHADAIARRCALDRLLAVGHAPRRWPLPARAPMAQHHAARAPDAWHSHEAAMSPGRNDDSNRTEELLAA